MGQFEKLFDAKTVIASETDIASGWLDVEDFDNLVASIKATGAAGGTLDVKMQHSPDKVEIIDLGAAFTQIVAVPANETKTFSGCHRYVRFIYSSGVGASYSLDAWLSSKK